MKNFMEALLQLFFSRPIFVAMYGARGGVELNILTFT